MGIGVLSVGPVAAVEVRQFLVSVTYLMAGSLILTGALQLTFTRFIADRLFDKEERSVLPNLLGALTLSIGAAGVLGSLVFVPLPDAMAWAHLGGSVVYRVLLVVTLATLSGCWITVVLLSGLKEYRRVMGSFLAGYFVSFVAALALRPFGLSGLLGGFLAGQILLLFLMLALVVARYPSDRLVSFDFLDRRRAYLSLSVTGLLYNVGIWIDKLIFWFTPSTSEPVLGPLRASIIYDLPIFLAYLSILPGMAVFLVRVETDFAEEYHALLRRGPRRRDAGRDPPPPRSADAGGAARASPRSSRSRASPCWCCCWPGPGLLDYVGISRLHLQLFSIDLVGVAMQVLMLAVFNVLFYLDERRAVLSLSALFVATNVVLTIASQAAGPGVLRLRLRAVDDGDQHRRPAGDVAQARPPGDEHVHAARRAASLVRHLRNRVRRQLLRPRRRRPSLSPSAPPRPDSASLRRPCRRARARHVAPARRPPRRRDRVAARARAPRRRQRGDVAARRVRGAGAGLRRVEALVRGGGAAGDARGARRRRGDLLSERHQARRPLGRQGGAGGARRRARRDGAALSQDRLPQAGRARSPSGAPAIRTCSAGAAGCARAPIGRPPMCCRRRG